MKRNDFSSGKKNWIVACAKCSKFKGHCACRADNITIIGREAEALISNMLLNGERPVVREYIGIAVSNPIGVVRSTFNLANAVGISQGAVHDNDPREWVEDEM